MTMGDALGFETIVIRTSMVGDMTWVKTHYDSVCRHGVSEWSNGSDDFTFTGTIPAVTTATVYMPAADPDADCHSDVPAAELDGVGVRSDAGARAK